MSLLAIATIIIGTVGGSIMAFYGPNAEPSPEPAAITEPADSDKS